MKYMEYVFDKLPDEPDLRLVVTNLNKHIRKYYPEYVDLYTIKHIPVFNEVQAISEIKNITDVEKFNYKIQFFLKVHFDKGFYVTNLEVKIFHIKHYTCLVSHIPKTKSKSVYSIYDAGVYDDVFKAVLNNLHHFRLNNRLMYDTNFIESKIKSSFIFNHDYI